MSQYQYRPDCLTRWKTIHTSMGDLSGKSMVDIGCANGFFCEMFLKNGGNLSHGVEVNGELREESKNIPYDGYSVYENIKELDGVYDFALFLDLYFDSSVNEEYLHWLRQHAKISFIAPSGDGRKNNQRLYDELIKIGYMVTPLEQTEYAHRMIYRCE